MKLSIAFTFVCTMFLFSCKDNTVNSSSEVPANMIVGRVIDWKWSDSTDAVAWLPDFSTGSRYILGRGRVAKDGTFKLELSAPPQALLYHDDRGGTYVFSDSLAKLSDFLEEFSICFPNGSFAPQRIYNASVKWWAYYSDSVKVGEVLSYFVYADRDVDVYGWESGIAYNGSNVPVDTISILSDYHFKKGWNRTDWKIIFHTPHNIKYHRSVGNWNEGNWYCEY